MIRAYYYIFYKLYKFWDYVSIPKFATEWKAGFSIIVLQIWIYFSCLNYYFSSNNLKTHVNFFDPFIVVPFILILLIDYIAFVYNNHIWKNYKIEFDQFSKKKNFIGGIIVWGIILSIIIFHFFII